ncbi:MAG: TetR/AcrR family transcriptional regulator [Alphaproteobacteria bacterium]|nr:TetR/AcrR family transcriptional regulator [Alphaproteobacteria bacterium]
MTYKVSDRTKEILIQTAGRLISENGFGNVSAKEIAKRAKMVPNAITYHFESKNNLFAAVWDYVGEHWSVDEFESYCRENEALLKTKAGQVELVKQAVRLLFEKIYPLNDDSWVSRFVARAMLTKEGKDWVHEHVVKPIDAQLGRLYYEITGSKDPTSAFCWGLNLVAAISYFSINVLSNELYKQKKLDAKVIYYRLLDSTINNALAELNLKA